MPAGPKILLAGLAAGLVAGCAGVRTGNAPADAIIYTALGVAEAKSAAQKEQQQAFEKDLAKMGSKGK
jgi:hypothetical protein